jgi:hypothetical protein
LYWRGCVHCTRTTKEQFIMHHCPVMRSRIPAAPSKRHRFALARAILACAALAYSSRAALADDIEWQSGVDDWFNANNWIDYSQPDGQGGQPRHPRNSSGLSPPQINGDPPLSPTSPHPRDQTHKPA